MIAFLTLESEEGNAQDLVPDKLSMKGIFEYEGHGGAGQPSEDLSKQRYVTDFDPPKLSEKNLTFEFSIYSISEDKIKESGSIELELDRSKAMGYTIKQQINKSIDVDDGNKVNFASITASPTITVVDGTVDLPDEILKLLMRNRATDINLDFDLLANGEAVEKQGGNIGNSMDGVEFKMDFDALPQNLDKLEIRLNKWTVVKNVDEKCIPVNFGPMVYFSIDGREVTINKIEVRNRKTYLTITTEENVSFPDMFLKINNKKFAAERKSQNGFGKSSSGKTTIRQLLSLMEQGMVQNW
jgi:hypothetical protein